jgi:predicted transcriptional regulator
MGDDLPQGGGKLDRTVRGEYRMPEARSLALAFFEMMLGRIRVIDAFRAAGGPSMTLTDLVVLIYCFIWAEDTGARAQEIINTMNVPRRSVRDSLRKLVDGNVLYRTKSGAYYPTDFAEEMANQLFQPWMNELRNLCDAYNEFEHARKKG